MRKFGEVQANKHIPDCENKMKIKKREQKAEAQKPV